MITINKGPGQRILELGGGDNPNSASDVKVDVRPGPSVDFVADLNEKLPIQDAEFDGVFSQFCLEHLSWRKVRQFLSECRRVLKPGGRVMIVTANTEAQFQFLKANPNGWDGKDSFDSFSCIIFGDNDYPENSHRNFMSPTIAHTLFAEAGFEQITTRAYGARSTDMYIEAFRPGEMATVPTQIEQPVQAPAPQPTNEISKYTTEELYDKHYFNGGSKVGGYAHEGYRDFLVHHVTAKHILWRRPKSVLELGASRGYVLKRILDAGIPGYGLEVSRHCLMTSAVSPLHLFQQDLTKTPWTYADMRRHIVPGSDKIDLCYSIAVLEHIPEQHIGNVIKEMACVAQRGLHGIDFGHKDDAFDKTHVLLRDKSWWTKTFEQYAPGWPVEIVDKEELEAGQPDKDVLQGDGKLKVNVGSHRVMFYHGWQNLDREPLHQFAQQNGYQFVHHDLIKGLPFDSCKVDLLTMHHVLEHFDYGTGTAILRECRRVLNPETGVMRLGVPDCRKLMAQYASDQFEPYEHISDPYEKAPTRMMKLWEIMMAGHAAMYDHEALAYVARQSNFEVLPDGSDHPGLKQLLKETTDSFPCLSLYMNLIPRTA